MLRFTARWLLFLIALTWLVPVESKGAQDEKQADEIARLVELLQNPDASVRLAAAAGLGDMADAARISRNLDRDVSPSQGLRETAAPELIKLVSDPNPAVRRMAVLAVGKVRAPGAAAAKAWLTALQDPAPSVRDAVPEALLSYCKRGDELTVGFKSAATLLPGEQFFTDVAAITGPFETCLRSANPKLVGKALEALDALADTLEKTPTLPEADNPDVPAAATEAFRKTLPPAAAALSKLMVAIAAVMTRPPTDNQRLAASFFEKMARICDPRPDLQSAGQGEIKRTRGRIVRTDLGAEGAEALQTLKAGLQAVLPTLIQLVAQPPICVQLAVLDTLEVLGPDAGPAVPAIRADLRSPDRFVRWASARTLARIGPVNDNLPTILGLAGLTKDDDLDVASSACDFLGEAFAKDAGPAVAALSRAAQSTERDVQYAAVGALARIVSAIGPAARDAVPGLIVALRSSDLKTRQSVPPILDKLGVEASPALPALEKALDDPDLDVRTGASKAILKIRGQQQATCFSLSPVFGGKGQGEGA